MCRCPTSFSPHTRGCIAGSKRFCATAGVFPAHAGLYRWREPCQKVWGCFPRTRGVVSLVANRSKFWSAFSPHTRGCISSGRIVTAICPVFPAHAGLYRKGSYRGGLLSRFPRTRGVVSPVGARPQTFRVFSPHTRGCIQRVVICHRIHGVFPAHAGLYRPGIRGPSQGQGFPRTRGVVSEHDKRQLAAVVFSPHTRGCIGRSQGYRHHARVFPAHAGLYLIIIPVNQSDGKFPRTRGVIFVPQCPALCTEVEVLRSLS